MAWEISSGWEQRLSMSVPLPWKYEPGKDMVTSVGTRSSRTPVPLFTNVLSL